MNPLRSTSSKILAHEDILAARVAVTQPYKADLEHFLDCANDCEAAIECNKSAPLVANGVYRAARMARNFGGALALSLGTARAKNGPNRN